MKILLFFLTLYSLLIFQNQAEANYKSIENLNFFEGKLRLISKHSFNKDGLINWSDKFVLLSK